MSPSKSGKRLRKIRDREQKIAKALLRPFQSPLPASDDDVREQTLITGTGVGKTATNLAGIKWKIAFRQS